MDKPDVHRAINVVLDDDLHDLVHDQSRPKSERAEALLDHLTEYNPLGHHWTTDPGMATYFHSYNPEGPHTTHVIFHASHPDEKDIITDPGWREEHEVNDSEDEVPVQRRADIEIKGISWRPNGRKTFEHHVFDDPQWHQASREGLLPGKVGSTLEGGIESYFGGEDGRDQGLFRVAGRGKPRHNPSGNQGAGRGQSQPRAGADDPGASGQQGEAGDVVGRPEGPRPVEFHPAAAKELGKLHKQVQTKVADTIDKLANDDPGLQTHALTEKLKGWYSTKVDRGHRVVHKPSGDGGIHIGYVGLHEYEKAIRRLTKRLGDGLYYRMHPKDAPFGPEHAYSPPIGASGEVARGYSTFSNPHHLHDYMHEMEWVGSPEVDWDDRHVVQFRGDRVGTGIDGEDLVIPHSDRPEKTMSWSEFEQGLGDRTGPGWSVDKAFRPHQASRERHPHDIALAYAQQEVRKRYPEMRTELPPRADRTLRVMLKDLGHPRADEAFVVKHEDPSRGASQVVVDEETGAPGVAIHPARWDQGTLAHEAAHIMHAHQENRPLLDQLDREHHHGPEYVGHYANALEGFMPPEALDFLHNRFNYARRALKQNPDAFTFTPKTSAKSDVCPCGLSVVLDPVDGWQHADGSVTHDGEHYGKSVSELMESKRRKEAAKQDVMYVGGYLGDIGREQEPGDFRRVLYTSPKCQLTAMTLQPGEDIGKETHNDVDQILMLIEGEGECLLGGNVQPFVGEAVLCVPQGVEHNIINTGKKPMRLATVYAPAHHAAGTVHHTKADAKADKGEEFKPVKTAIRNIDPIPRYQELAKPWEKVIYDVPEKVDKPIFRGMAIPLSQEEHDYVHDRSIRPATRAARVVDLVAKEPLGMHWSVDDGQAHHWSRVPVQGMDEHPHVLSVVLHAHPPEPEHIEHDPRTLWHHSVQGHVAEGEVPLKQGAPVRIHGVEWSDARDYTKSHRFSAGPGARGIIKNAKRRPKLKSRIFGPSKGSLDPALFEGTHLRPEVRTAVLSRLGAVLEPILGKDWERFTKVYLAGSQASEWWGNHDFDTLIGIDFDHLGGEPGIPVAGLEEDHITDMLNSALRASYNASPWKAPFGGEWDLTGYVNANSYDIRKIKPYAAYNISDNAWAVRPPHLLDWSVEKFPAGKGMLDEAKGYADIIEAIDKMPEPFRTQQGQALWEHLHGDRSRAFSERGEGWTDPGNAIEKALVEWGLWDKLVAIKFGPQKTAGAQGDTPNLIFHHHDYGDQHQLIAEEPDNGEIGYLSWSKSEQPTGEVGENCPTCGRHIWEEGHAHPAGEIEDIDVNPLWRRRGVGRAMLEYARSMPIEPKPVHSQVLTDDGRAWAEKTAAKEPDDQQDLENEFRENWETSSHLSKHLTGASAHVMGIPGYKHVQKDVDWLGSPEHREDLAKAALRAIKRNAGSPETLYHGGASSRFASAEPGDHIDVPLKATSGAYSVAHSYAGYGGKGVIMHFPKGTPHFEQPGVDAENWADPDDRYSVGEGVVAGRFRVKEKAVDDLGHTHLKLEHVAHFDPDLQQWTPSRTRKTSSKGEYCPTCKTEHQGYFEPEDHERSHTDWDRYYDKIRPDIHRGMAVQLSPDAHRIVHGDAPEHEKAQALMDELSSTPLGMHWTDNSAEMAGNISQEDAEKSFTPRQRQNLTHVIFHADKPAREHIETDIKRLVNGSVISYPDSPESEVPLKEGAPVNVWGVSWKRHDPQWNPYDTHEDEGSGWHFHEFKRPVTKTASDRPKPVELPPEQREAFDAPDYRRKLLQLAQNPVPGTHIWRGEVRKGDPLESKDRTVGMHWSVHPDDVLHQPVLPGEGTRNVLWHGVVDDPAEQTFDRSHPMWRDHHMSWDKEAEIRLKPGSKVHMKGVWIKDPDHPDPGIPPVPRHPELTGPGWTYHPINEHVPVAHKPMYPGMIDYTDVGVRHEGMLGYFTASDDLKMRTNKGKRKGISHTTITAYSGDQKVGHVRMVSGDTEIDDLYVVPQMRGQGVAHTLMNEAIDRFGHQTLRLHASPFGKGGLDKDSLVGFYSSHGFEPEEDRGSGYMIRRPGTPKTASEDDYRMQHRPPDTDFGSPHHDIGDDVMPDLYRHPEHYDHSGESSYWDSFRQVSRTRGKPDAKVRIYRALPAEHAHQGFRPGDWVSTSKEYAINHGKQEDPEHDWPVISTMVPAKHLQTDGNDLREWGYTGPHEEYPMISFKGGYHQEVSSRADGKVRPVQRRKPKTAIADYFEAVA